MQLKLCVCVCVQGVLSKAVNWTQLEKQYAINSRYEEEIIKLLEYCGVSVPAVSQEYRILLRLLSQLYEYN